MPMFSRLAELVLQRHVPILITWALLLALAIPILSPVPERLRRFAPKIPGRATGAFHEFDRLE